MALLHTPGSHVHSNLTLYYVHGTLCIERMCVAGISTVIHSKVYVLEKTETGSCINSMQAISYINSNGRFTVTGWNKCGVTNSRSVITVNSTGNQNNSNRNKKNPDIQVENGEIHFHARSIQQTNIFFLDQTHEIRG